MFHKKNSQHVSRINGLWLTISFLVNTIDTKWTPSYMIIFGSKGFFYVYFNNPKDHRKTMQEGPWFGGRHGIFLKPKYTKFNLASIIISSAPVWVILQYLPLSLWENGTSHKINNTLGNFIDLIQVKTRKEFSLIPKLMLRWTLLASRTAKEKKIKGIKRYIKSRFCTTHARSSLPRVHRMSQSTMILWGLVVMNSCILLHIMYFMKQKHFGPTIFSRPISSAGYSSNATRHQQPSIEDHILREVYQIQGHVAKPTSEYSQGLNDHSRLYICVYESFITLGHFSHFNKLK